MEEKGLQGNIKGNNDLTTCFLTHLDLFDDEEYTLNMFIRHSFFRSLIHSFIYLFIHSLAFIYSFVH